MRKTIAIVLVVASMLTAVAGVKQVEADHNKVTLYSGCLICLKVKTWLFGTPKTVAQVDNSELSHLYRF
jgi:hypothetical protein